MSLDNGAAPCQLPPYPTSIQYPAAVTYIESSAIVLTCGGYNRDNQDSEKCFAFDGSSWIPLPDSSRPHCWYDSSDLIVDQSWWISGSLQNKSDGYCSDEWTSEIFNGDEWIQGPQHPTGSSVGSCLVQLNSTYSLYTGGNPSWSESWLYDWTSGQWEESSKLNEERRHHSCAVLEGQGVLVAGGYNDGSGYVYSVELYDPETGIWTLQPGLPQEIYPVGPVLLPGYKGNVIGLFMFTDQVYQRTEDGIWSPLEGVVLPNSYYYDGATLVSDDFAYDCL